MRGSKAKLIRRDAKIRSAGLPDKAYTKTNERTKFAEVGIGLDGLPKKVSYKTFTVMLDACVRLEYKNLKKYLKALGNKAKKVVVA